MLLQRQKSFERDVEKGGRMPIGGERQRGTIEQQQRKASRASGLVTLPPIQDRPELVTERKKGCARIKAFCQRIYRKFGLRHFVPLVIVIFYNILGAILFLVIEKAADDHNIATTYSSYMDARTEVVKKIMEIAEESGEEPVKRKLAWDTINWYDANVSLKITNATQWDFWNSMFFAGTVYTTIGYGNIYCKTTLGQIATMIYSILGIPLVLAALSDLGKWFYKSLYMLVIFVERIKRDRLIHRRVEEKKAQRKVTLATLNQIPILQPPSAVVRDEGAGNDVESGYAESTTQPPPGPFSQSIRVASVPSQPSIDSYRSVELPLAVNAATVEVDTGSSTSRSAVVAADVAMTIPTDDDIEDMVLDELEVDEAGAGKGARVPVWLAVTFTVSWIFVCAAIFCTWEDWSYFTSIYFFVISLSTIGLGDVTPDYPQYMVLAYLLVIAGLALVSMCINVIQKALEELFMKLLMKVLVEYQKRIASGEDQVGATMGMMGAFSNSPATKYLMPLLGKGNTQSMVQKFQTEAKAQGIELPPVLAKLDAETGLPAILTAGAKHEHDEQPLQQLVEDAIVQAHAEMEDEEDEEVAPVIIRYMAHTQTEVVATDERQQQTTDTELFELAVQTLQSYSNLTDNQTQTTPSDTTTIDTQTLVAELSEQEAQTVPAIYEETVVQTANSCWDTVDADAQTDETAAVDGDTQTALLHMVEDMTQTATVTLEEADAQTSTVVQTDQELQTHCYELATRETQYEPIFTKNERIQTPAPEMQDVLIQAALDPNYSTVTKKNKTLANARWKIRRVLGMKSKKRRYGHKLGASSVPSISTCVCFLLSFLLFRAMSG